MAEQDAHHHVEITDGDRTIASADVTTAQDCDGTAVASLHVESGHIPQGARAGLVDAVLDLPEVQRSPQVQVAVPRGDGESLLRLQERCDKVTTRAAGATSFVAAQPPSERKPDSDC
jgi:hypothetical protein